jgi:hypothetical protein
MEKPNRADRRKSKFGGGRATEHGGWPTHLPNPVFGGEPPAEEAASAKPAHGKPSAKSTVKAATKSTDGDAVPKPGPDANNLRRAEAPSRGAAVSERGAES